MQFSLDRKQRKHKQNQCSVSDSVGLIFTRSYHSTLLITTPTTTPSLVETSVLMQGHGFESRWSPENFFRAKICWIASIAITTAMVTSPFYLYSHSSNQLHFMSHPCLSKYIWLNLKDALRTTQTRNTRRMDFCLDSNLSSNFFGQSQYSLIEIIPRWKIEYVLQWLKSKDHDHNPPCATWIPGLQLFPSSAISLPH